MCSNCSNILTGFSIKHTPEGCPLKESLSCSYCNKKGHSTLKCTVLANAKNDLEYSWSSSNSSNKRVMTFKPTLNIRNDEQTINAYLRANNVAPSQKESSIARHKKNMELLNEVATGRGLTVLPHRKKSPPL